MDRADPALHTRGTDTIRANQRSASTGLEGFCTGLNGAARVRKAQHRAWRETPHTALCTVRADCTGRTETRATGRGHDPWAGLSRKKRALWALGF